MSETYATGRESEQCSIVLLREVMEIAEQLRELTSPDYSEEVVLIWASREAFEWLCGKFPADPPGFRRGIDVDQLRLRGIPVEVVPIPDGEIWAARENGSIERIEITQA